MNVDVFFQIARYCPIHELVRDWQCVSKEWNSWLRSPAANVRLWMCVTDELVVKYFSRPIPVTSINKWYKESHLQYKINWMKQAITIQKHLIALRYSIWDREHCIYLLKVPSIYSTQKYSDNMMDYEKWYCFQKMEHDYVLTSSSHQPLHTSFPLWEKVVPNVLGFDREINTWFVERLVSTNNLMIVPICSICSVVIEPTSTHIYYLRDALKCEKCC